MSDRHQTSPEQLRRSAEVAGRLYELAAYRFNHLVDRVLSEASGETTVRQLVDIVTEVARNSDYWDDILQELYERSLDRYPPGSDRR